MTAGSTSAGPIGDLTPLDSPVDDAPLHHPLRTGDWLLIVGFFFLGCAFFLPLLGQGPLAGTEAHRGLTAHQMVVSGEWLVPRLFDRIYLAKPPLHYWLQGAFEWISGRPGVLTWRLPAAFDGALLAAICCAFGCRWFGRLGGIVSGIAYLGLFVMWGEDRGGELDATNTLTATIGVLCLIELHFAHPKRRWIWIIVAALAIAGSFMSKGPASLPILLGVLVYAAIDYIRRGESKRLLGPATWVPLLLGAGLFALYGWAVYHFLKTHHWALDRDGIDEGLHDVRPANLMRLLEALGLPFTLFGYALPISIGLIWNFLTDLRDPVPERQRLADALAFAVLLGWAISAVTGMHTPRYAYVTLPALCPLAGALAARWSSLGERGRRALGWTVIGSAIAYWLATLTLVGSIHKQHASTLFCVALVGAGTVILAALLGGLIVTKTWRPAWLMLPLLFVLSLTFAVWKNDDRQRHSTAAVALWIRQTVGQPPQLLTGLLVLDQPDLFYLTGLPTHAVNGQLGPEDVRGEDWILLEEPELGDWKRRASGRLLSVQQFTANHNVGYLVHVSVPTHHHASTRPHRFTTEPADSI